MPPVRASLLKTYGWTLLSASVFPVALVCSLFWFLDPGPANADDVDKAFQFRQTLVEILRPYQIQNLDVNLLISPRIRGRGTLFLQNPEKYPLGEMEIIRHEFEQLNGHGSYTLDRSMR